MQQMRLVTYFFAFLLITSNTIAGDKSKQNVAIKQLDYKYISSLPRLTGTVILEGSEITEFPEYLCYLRNITAIGIELTNIVLLPKCLENHSSTVTRLEINNNSKLNAIKFDVGTFKNATFIGITGNPNLFKKTISIPSMPNLITLDLSSNGMGLSTVHHLGSMPNLKYLTLNDNKIGAGLARFWILTTIPSLQSLELKGVGLNSVPGMLPFLTNLKDLDLRENPLSDANKAHITGLMRQIGTAIKY